MPSCFYSSNLPADIVVAKSALFRTPKRGHPSWRSLAPPLPTEPASLGFGGDPNDDRPSFLPWALGPTCAKLKGLCAAQTPPSATEPGQRIGEGLTLHYTPTLPTGERQSEALQKAFLPTFFSKKVGKRGVGWQTGYSLVCCVRRTNFITWRKPIWTMKKLVL